MALPKSNTTVYSGNKKAVARYVKDQLNLLKPDSAWITIIHRDISGEPYAIFATDASSADIERLTARLSSTLPQPISEVLTPDGLSLNERNVERSEDVPD